MITVFGLPGIGYNAVHDDFVPRPDPGNDCGPGLNACPAVMQGFHGLNGL